MSYICSLVLHFLPDLLLLIFGGILFQNRTEWNINDCRIYSFGNSANWCYPAQQNEFDNLAVVSISLFENVSSENLSV